MNTKILARYAEKNGMTKIKNTDITPTGFSCVETSDLARIFPGMELSLVSEKPTSEYAADVEWSWLLDNGGEYIKIY